jgi:hypothetical protein
MKMWRIVTLTIVLVSISGPLLAGFTPWLAPWVQTRLGALAPPVAMALVLVLYFEWRARLKRRIVADNRHDELARAA